MANSHTAKSTEFVVTREHRRFTEFCDAVRRHRYIGVCYGAAGIGKTVSAYQYSGWDVVEPFIRNPMHLFEPAPVAANDSRTVVYTPTVSNSPRRVEKELDEICRRFDWAVELVSGNPIFDATRKRRPSRRLPNIELLIVDEADRLTTGSLEHLRDHHDRTGVGLALIGMPGIERRLARYPQLYSRVGFAHEFRALRDDDLLLVLQHHFEALGKAWDGASSEATAAIARITQGNFRLVGRVFAQIERVLDINALDAISRDVVEAAREALVIGTN